MYIVCIYLSTDVCTYIGSGVRKDLGIWIRFRVCSPVRNDGTSENKVTFHCFKEQEGQAGLLYASVAIIMPCDTGLLRSLFSDVIPATVLTPLPRRILECALRTTQLRPLRNHFGAKPPPTHITSGLERLLLTRERMSRREGRGRCGYAAVGSARELVQTQKLTAEDKQLVDACSSSVTEVCTSKLRDVAYVLAAYSRKTDALVITCSNEYPIARGIINSSNVIKSTAKCTDDSVNNYPSNLSRTYSPVACYSGRLRNSKLTEVVPSSKLASRSIEACYKIFMVTLVHEYSDTQYPFTGNWTNVNARFRSKRGWVSNNLNNFTIVVAFARPATRNKLYSPNFKIDDRVVSAHIVSLICFSSALIKCFNVAWIFMRLLRAQPSIALNDRIFRNVGYEKDKHRTGP
ncbi:hypothetical protein EAG_03581 [Camponotus floridanus]|uniref:Uncharacterized protein n=1 Tax=Camponotus floridanus TaxID=104421 RepID=E2ANX9_CAMFO|nr:hypothetical protein EAG_03581 [Camponotus floridanus]